MKFSNFVYKRPDYPTVATKFDQLISQFNTATAVAEQNEVIEKINVLRSDYQTMFSIASTRHNIDTTDDTYTVEQSYVDKERPAFSGLTNRFYKALVNSKYRQELEKTWGKQLFVIADLSLKSFDDSIIGYLQKENQLVSRYIKLLASAEIPFEGEVRNLSGFGKFFNSKDRAMRIKVREAYYGFFTEHQHTLDDIFDQLVHLRHEMAQALGFKNFVEMAYARMKRSDYTAEDVAHYRKMMEKHVVPLATKLRKRQQNRLGLEDFYHFDESLEFNSGNPTPKGDAEWIVANAEKMYEELSPETNEFFQFMKSNELMDLVNRKGKAGGGYCTVFKKYKSPFIFSNFNGTSGDIKVLTHEAGHAFQAYSSIDLITPEYNFPTMEAAEIHSMSMELLTWDWMHYFFEEDTDKFKFSHLSRSITFLPYGVAVDEFQHFVYENPNISPEERNKEWRRIEQKYMPHRVYNGIGYLESGRFWQQQRHIYKSPFYYIDYTLAQVCALQFWKRYNENPEKAMEDYTRLCKAGGSQSFLNLVKLAKLRSPFEETTLVEVMAEAEAWLEKVDDTLL
ncbi:MAG: M3 family oligoendopeptidase [Chitinophagales bacterium]